MSKAGDKARRKLGFRGPSKHDNYTVWVDFKLGRKPAERKQAFTTVSKALKGKGARTTGRKWLTEMAGGRKDNEQELAVFIGGCSKAKARAEKVNKVMKAAGIKGKTKVFHEALYSTRPVRKCPLR